MPRMHGLEVITRVRETQPRVRFLVVSAHCSPWAVSQLRKLRLEGFLDKQTDNINRISRALLRVAAGDGYFSPRYKALTHELQGHGCPLDRLLTRRELELLALITMALPDPAIAERAWLSVSTVKTHRSRILKS